MIRFICAQPSELYFVWQVEVMLNNFIEMGVDLQCVDIVCTKENNKIPEELSKVFSKNPNLLNKLYANSYFTETDLQGVENLTAYKAESTSTNDYKNMSIAEVSSVFEKYKNKLIENKIGNPLDLLSHFRNSAFTNEDIEEFLELCK